MYDKRLICLAGKELFASAVVVRSSTNTTSVEQRTDGSTKYISITLDLETFLQFK